MNILGVIPARYQSSRFPGKPLADICGHPMLWWVYQQAKKSERLSDVIIATDDERILNACEKEGMNAVMTSDSHDTPTSRLYEISTRFEADLYLMLMGDEPLINPESFSLVIPKETENEYYVGVLSNCLDNPAEVIDYTNQKVVSNAKREVMLISRSPIPYPKGSLDIRYEKVTGIQIFSKKALEFYNETPKSKLECAEENDLMRFVENGIPVKVTLSPYKTVSVDSYKDLSAVTEIISERIGR